MARRAREKGSAEVDTPTPEPEPKSSAAREWFKSVLIAGVLFLFLRTFVLQTFVITSGSMENTLLVGDMLIANRLALGSRIPGTSIRIPGYSEPHRGDVMVFDPHHEVDMKLVKRLVGFAGDTLQMQRGVLSVNGDELNELYLNPERGGDERHPDFEWQREYLASDVDPATYTPTRQNWGPVVVPPDHYFMLGDNRDASLDSRYWGPLASWRLEGRVSLIYFSYNRQSYRPFPAVREIRWGRLVRSLTAASEN